MEDETEKKETKEENIKTKARKKIYSFLKWFGLVVVVAIIGWVVMEYLTSWKQGDISSKFIAVVMSGTDKSFTIPLEFKQGFGDQPSIKTSNGQIIFIEKKEDLYSIEQAKIVADKLMNDDRCVLIIGNSNSELTEVTLNSILDSDNRPAFILPIATADNIISKANSEGYKSILRMVPDNDNQASIIKRFIFSKIGNNAKVALLVDEENQTYSNNLSKNISAKIIADNGNVVLDKQYGISNRLINEIEPLRKNNIFPDIIVYVGVSSNGMLLIEELKALKIDVPIIFTDGCTVKDLIKKAKELKNESFFLSAVSKSDTGIEPTYEPIGKDAFSLAQKILNSIEQPITRESIRNYVANNKGNILLDAGYAGAYAFTDDGNNKLMNFIIYSYQNDILKEVKGIK